MLIVLAVFTNASDFLRFEQHTAQVPKYSYSGTRKNMKHGKGTLHTKREQSR